MKLKLNKKNKWMLGILSMIVLSFCFVVLKRQSAVNIFANQVEQSKSTGSYREREKDESQESHQPETINKAENRQQLSEKSQAGESKKDEKNGIEFFSKAEIKALGNEMTSASNYLDRKKGVITFQKSKLDTLENYKKAKNQLLKDYANELDKTFLYQRVTAINFLKYSKHIKEVDCAEILTELNSDYEKESDKMIKANISFDAAIVAEGCGRKNRRALQAFSENRKISPVIKAYLEKAIHEQNI